MDCKICLSGSKELRKPFGQLRMIKKTQRLKNDELISAYCFKRPTGNKQPKIKDVLPK